MDEIRELDQTTIERIAAGEVVERPASVVKELVENSLDAGASRVKVSVEAGGTDAIRVRDDGVGMSESAVRTAVREHTTSKIRDIGDLESGVGTLGFRGEALHAIGAVSRMTITTRERGSDRGTRLRVEGGEVTAVESAGCPEGTTVAVEDLFYNVPARRKYLSRDATEFDHVHTVVRNYALANPDVAITLEHDGRETFATAGQGSLRAVVMAVYGRDVAESMLAVTVDSLPEGPLEDVTGLLSHPETTRADRRYVTTFVNDRFVRESVARNAIVDGYGDQLAADRYPFAVLSLSLPARTLDVNVHPRKLEVRFADESGLREQVRTAVRETLLAEGLVRSRAPRGRSAPTQTEIDPATAPASNDDPPDDDGAPEESTPGESEIESSSRADERVSGTAATRQRTDGRNSDRSAGKPPANRESEQTRGTDDVSERDESAVDAPGSTLDNVADATHDGRTTDPAHETKTDSTTIDSGSQRRLDPDAAPLDRDFSSLPAMRVLGQFQETYVVAETDTGLVLIDQHAADERINYERLRERFAGETTTQTLAQPIEIDLTARESTLFEQFQPVLEGLGFEARRADDRTVTITAVPAMVAETADPGLLRDVLSSLVETDADPDEPIEAAADDVLADLACYPSITGNTSLTEGSIVDLLERLDTCANPYACPHGRPVVIEIDADELADRFERDYPGHSSRQPE